MISNRKPILFLDCDDVLNTPHTYEHAWHLDLNYLDQAMFDPLMHELAGRDTPVAKALLAKAYAEAFTPSAVALLNQLQAQYEMVTVISSSWADSMDKADFERIFANTGLKLELHANWKTPRTKESSRAQEIFQWLKAEKHPKRFLILDDTDSGSSLIEHTYLRPSTVFCDYDCQTQVGDRSFRSLKGLNTSHLADIHCILQDI